jgi:hypothetical protein
MIVMFWTLRVTGFDVSPTYLVDEAQILHNKVLSATLFRS